MRWFSVPLLVVALGLVQCSPQSGDETPAATNFRSLVTVTLTPATVERLRQRQEVPVVDAFYFGTPTQDSASMADSQDGTIHLASNVIKLPVEATQTVHLKAEGLDPARLEDIGQQKPIVRIVVYAGKDGQRLKTMLCDEYQDYVEVAQAKPVALRCDLNQD